MYYTTDQVKEQIDNIKQRLDDKNKELDTDVSKINMPETNDKFYYLLGNKKILYIVYFEAEVEEQDNGDDVNKTVTALKVRSKYFVPVADDVWCDDRVVLDLVMKENVLVDSEEGFKNFVENLTEYNGDELRSWLGNQYFENKKNYPQESLQEVLGRLNAS